jgi:hypothetical protein
MQQVALLGTVSVSLLGQRVESGREPSIRLGTVPLIEIFCRLDDLIRNDHPIEIEGVS